MSILRERKLAGPAFLAVPITALVLAALLLTWSQGSSTQVAAQQQGTEGLNFTLHVGATCDTSAGTEKCQLDEGEVFPVTVTLDDISGIGGAAYDALAVTIQFSGVTSNMRLDMQPPDNWPGCVFEATAFAPTFENVGCTIGIGAEHSTYTGVIATGEFMCAASGTMSLSHNAADTLVIDANGLTLFEAGQDELTINCGGTPPEVVSPTPTNTPPRLTPTNTPGQPTPTNTPRPPTPTATPGQPTATRTAAPPTATVTLAPPTEQVKPTATKAIVLPPTGFQGGGTGLDGTTLVLAAIIGGGLIAGAAGLTVFSRRLARSR